MVPVLTSSHDPATAEQVGRRPDSFVVDTSAAVAVAEWIESARIAAGTSVVAEVLVAVVAAVRESAADIFAAAAVVAAAAE